jgi:hypothetical protein
LESLGGAREPRLVTETPDLDQHPIVTKLRAWKPEAIAEALFFRGETTLVVPREWLRRVADYLASEPDLDFKLLVDITAVDRFPVEPRFELNYHMVSLSRRERLRVRVRVAGRDPGGGFGYASVAHGQLARARDLRSVRRALRGTSGFAAHSDAR